MNVAARDRIIDTAAELFATQGISRTSMAEIARAAGISRAWLYRNFESRDPIVHALLARLSERIALMLTEGDQPDRPVDEAVAAVFRYAVRKGRRERFFQELLANDPQSVVTPAVTVLERYLVDQREVLPPPQGRIAAEAIARLILSAVTVSSATMDFDDEGVLTAFAQRVIPPLLRPE